jgi:hypothetical protein
VSLVIGAGNVLIPVPDTMRGLKRVLGISERWSAILILVCLVLLLLLGLVGRPPLLTLVTFCLVITSSAAILLVVWLLDLWLVMTVTGLAMNRFNWSEPLEQALRVAGIAGTIFAVYSTAQDLIATDWAQWGLGALRRSLTPWTGDLGDHTIAVFNRGVFPLFWHAVAAAASNIGRIVFHVCRYTLAPWSWISFTIGLWRAA